MTQKEKDLILKDLSCRLPYRPLISINGERYRMEEIRNALIGIDTYKTTVDGCDIEQVKPYLFPRSSMTSKQMEEYESLCIKVTSERTEFYTGVTFTTDDFYDTVESIEYLYKNHIDVNGLIPMGLAIDATGKRIY